MQVIFLMAGFTHVNSYGFKTHSVLPFWGHFKALLKVTIVEAAMHVCSCILFMSGTETTFGSTFKA